MNSESMKALVRNASKATGVEPLTLLMNVMMERFLERISISVYKSNFILKGGMLIASMIGVDQRSTKDMDATIRHMHATKERMVEIVTEIIETPLDDGVHFEILRVRNIREDFE